MSSVSVGGERHILLVGSNHQENLALQYLAAALENSGFVVQVVGFNERADAPAVLAQLNATPPLLVGIQIAFQYAVDDGLWLGECMRDAGYRGHITAGGHVATFCYAELLEGNSPLDSVVRHEGEVTLCEMAMRLLKGETLLGLAGCAFRGADGVQLMPIRPLCRHLDELAFPRRPDMPYRVAGVPIAFVVASRGCHGDCNYCCINAFTRDAGGPGYRLRSAENVAAELVPLAKRGVRVVFFQDDLFLLPGEKATMSRLEGFAKAMHQQQLPRLQLWIKGRPEAVTRNVLRAAKQLGALHLFLGIENACNERLKYLGRTHQAEDAERALALCAEEGVHPSFNVMLFDPESTLAHVEQNLDFMERHNDLPWNLCRTEIYPGTRLFATLSAAERLRGDYRSWGYVMTCPEAELLFRIARVSLHERALATRSLQNRLISLAFAWQLHMELFPGKTTQAIAAEAVALGIETRLDTVAMLRRAAEWVKNNRRFATPREVSEFAVEEGRQAGLRDFPRHQQAERLWDMLQARGIAFTEPATQRPMGNAAVQLSGIQ